MTAFDMLMLTDTPDSSWADSLGPGMCIGSYRHDRL